MAVRNSLFICTIAYWVFGPPTCQAQNLSACISEEGSIVVRGNAGIGAVRLDLISSDGRFSPTSNASPVPFEFLLNNTPYAFVVANLSGVGPVTIEDELVLPVRYETSGTSVSDIAADLQFVWDPNSMVIRVGEIAQGVFCTPIRGDFNLDRVVDRSDIDLLSSAIADPVPDFSFDLSGDDQLSQDDLELFLHRDFISDGNKLNGDADFSGFVGFPDFLILSSNFGEDGKKWSQGDFVANGRVVFEDFLVLSVNFGEIAMAAEPVPEPMGICTILLGLGLIYFHGRSHTPRKHIRPPSIRTCCRSLCSRAN